MLFSVFLVVTKHVSLKYTWAAAEMPLKSRMFSCTYGMDRCS